MRQTFADTFYLLAMINPRDSAHPSALAAGDSLSGRLVTTEFILLEVADALAAASEREKFISMLDRIRANPTIIVVPASSKLLARGLELYRERPDKDWSLTDCISFVVMTQRGITEALTGDHHFRQAGFMPLLC